MANIKAFTVVPSFPEKLLPLKELSYNLWFGWHPEVAKLFRRMDVELWEETYHNPILFLGRIGQEKISEAAEDMGFMTQLKEVYQNFQRYMQNSTMFYYDMGQKIDFKVAYFSAEYGIYESLPIYSGGLGILSGDHLKSASDLNFPLVGIGLIYQFGYFHQRLNYDGWQQENYSENDFFNMPILLEKDENGDPRKISIKINNRTIYAQIWRVQIGRIPLYLLDTNVPENPAGDRIITGQLYGGDREMRLRQEIVLGIGGVRALHFLGYDPAVYHMNEGHSAFASLERIRFLMKEKSLAYDEAFEIVYASNVFTTHTSVPAGNDVFPEKLIETYLGEYIKEIDFSMKDLLTLGRQKPDDENELFSMPVLAIKTSAQVNGVSRLHSQVSRKMWRNLWPALLIQDVPIVQLTNGVHVPSWVSHDIALLYDRYLSGRWIEDSDNEKVWEGIKNIPNTELWRTHERRRERLVGFCRRRLREQMIQRKASPKEIEAVSEILTPEALTIGFARRFATYKRGNLLFDDPDRLAKILNDPEQPVQVIFAGKAHPADNPGKELIKNIIQTANEPRFRNKIVFIEDYDINVARYLVQGVDIWLNTPQRPLEACGTSGMKAAANGALNMSVLDGWWCEAYNGENGWAIGNGEEFNNSSYQDEIDAKSIYSLLENEVIPLFFTRSSDGLPQGWIARMKASLRSICPVFNTHRMLEEYMTKFYITAAKIGKQLKEENFIKASEVAEWKRKVFANWDKIQVRSVEFENHQELPVGSKLPVRVDLALGNLRPEDIQVALYYGPLNAKQEFAVAHSITMHLEANEESDSQCFVGEIPCENTGRYGFLVRILPSHHLQINPFVTGKILWI